MRTIIKAAAVTLPLAIVLSLNAHAASWKCEGGSVACSTPSGPSYVGAHKKSHQTAVHHRSTSGAYSGLASWYGGKFHGRKTANGERFNQNALTAAHKTLPFGTRVRVTNVNNGRSVVVRINDRGPYVRGRVIDLSRAAASRIGVSGVSRVRLTVVGRG